jgi:hypothetical protein
MNLRAFLGQDVLVQLRGPWHLIVADGNAQPTIAMTQARPAAKAKSPIVALHEEDQMQPQVAPLMVPFAQGRFVDIEGEIFFSYVPEPSTGHRIDVQFHPDAIFSISRVHPRSAIST